MCSNDPIKPVAERDEFNFSVNLQLSAAPIDHVRANLIRLAHAQHERKTAA